MTLDQRGYYNISDAATLLGVNRITIWRWIRDGRLPASRLGHRTTRIKREDLERLLDRARPAARSDGVRDEAAPAGAEDRPAPSAGLTDPSADGQLAGRLQLARLTEQPAYHDDTLALRLRDEFFSIAAHEQSLPITGLSDRAQLVLSRLARDVHVAPEQVIQALQAVAAESDQLAWLVDQLLELSRLDADEAAPEPRPSDFGVIIEQIVSQAQALSDRSDATITGPAAREVVVAPPRLRQVLTSLVDNAIKYGPEGIPIDVVVSPAAPEVVELSVRGRGPGMPPGQRIQFFERFYRDHGAGRKSGLGIGQFISRQIVDLHGGEIRAEFPPEGGARFVVRLPIGLVLVEPAPPCEAD